jgi:hypothetical protein
MKWEQLKKILSDVPDDYEVILSSDGEGNSFSPVSDYSVGVYFPESSYSGKFLMGEDVEPGVRDNCVVLWPIN